MKTLRLALFLALLGLAPAQAQQAVIVPATTASIPITGTVATAASIITGLSGKSIYITSLVMIPAASTGTIAFTAGTGAACAGSPVTLTGIMTFAAGQQLILGTGNGAILVVPAGLNLCVAIGAQVAPGWLAFSQF